MIAANTPIKKWEDVSDDVHLSNFTGCKIAILVKGWRKSLTIERMEKEWYQIKYRSNTPNFCLPIIANQKVFCAERTAKTCKEFDQFFNHIFAQIFKIYTDTNIKIYESENHIIILKTLLFETQITVRPKADGLEVSEMYYNEFKILTKGLDKEHRKLLTIYDDLSCKIFKNTNLKYKLPF